MNSFLKMMKLPSAASSLLRRRPISAGIGLRYLPRGRVITGSFDQDPEELEEGNPRAGKQGQGSAANKFNPKLYENEEDEWMAAEAMESKEFTSERKGGRFSGLQRELDYTEERGRNHGDRRPQRYNNRDNDYSHFEGAAKPMGAILREDDDYEERTFQQNNRFDSMRNRRNHGYNNDRNQSSFYNPGGWSQDGFDNRGARYQDRDNRYNNNDRRDRYDNRGQGNGSRYNNRRDEFETQEDRYYKRKNDRFQPRNRYNDRQNNFDSRDRYNDGHRGRNQYMDRNEYGNQRNREHVVEANHDGEPRNRRQDRNDGENEWEDDNNAFRPQTRFPDKRVPAWKKGLDRPLDADLTGEDIVEKDGRQFTGIPFNVTHENKFEIINKIVCPYHLVTYDNQLKRKYNEVTNILKEMSVRLKKGNSPVVADGRGLPCPLEFTKKSPCTVQYRNKDEFSIFPGVDGNPKTVGFFIGEPSKHHNVVCVEPDNLLITKDSHKLLARKFQEYLREVSPLDVCLNFSEGGNWRRFTVRSNEAGEHMVIAQMHPQLLTDQEIEEEKQRLGAFFRPMVEEMNIKSLYLQAALGTRNSSEEAPFQLIFGQETINETILGKSFLISPESFFQINTKAAEVLFQTVVDQVKPTKDMTVIDLCSGTGTVSILLAPHVSRVIGIEQSKQAVDDAKKNAHNNGVRNVNFICGKAEDEMPALMDTFFGQNVVLVANPSRAGLRSSLVSMIRELNYIEKIVYVSCKPGGDALRNFVHLCLSPGGRADLAGNPFVPVNAVPVDMFPQTAHVEMVLTLERFLNK